VYGYAPYWTDLRYIRYDLLTHIGIFDVTLNPDGSITNDFGFPGHWAGVIDRARRNGVKCELVVTCFGWYNIHHAIRSPASIPNIVTLAETTGMDGVNIDFEEIWHGDRDSLVLFMQALSRACRAAGLELTMATMPLDHENAYDFRALADTTDGLFIMAYNFHWQGGPEAGPVAPLTGWDYYGNVGMSISQYLAAVGDGRKLYLGLPWYGYQWPTHAETTRSRTRAVGEAITYNQYAGRARVHGRLWDAESQTPWYRFNDGGWHQGWCDDDTSLLLKFQEVHEHDFLGTGMWALGYEGARPELWAALREAYNPPLDAFTNGGFEEWRLDTLAVPSDTTPNPVGWYEGRRARYRRDDAVVRSGASAVRHQPDSLGFPWPAESRLFQDVRVEPGRLYEFSGWARKNDSLGNRLWLAVDWHDARHRVLGTDLSPILERDSAAWVPLTTGPVTAPSGAASARLSLRMTGYGGWCHWDDLAFDPGAVVEAPGHSPLPDRGPTIIRGSLNLPQDMTDWGHDRIVPNSDRVPHPVGHVARPALLDISGRKVMDLKPGPNDVSGLAPGVYFVRSRPAIHRVVVTR